MCEIFIYSIFKWQTYTLIIFNIYILTNIYKCTLKKLKFKRFYKKTKNEIIYSN